MLGAAFAVAAWLGGTLLDYVVSLALLPASSVAFAQRLANEPFLAWLEPQLVPFKLLELLAAALVGWRTAR
jgi:hypothetical protein